MNEILVSCSRREKSGPYVEALARVGVESSGVRVLPADETDRNGLAELAAGAAGWLLCGGPDLHPKYYSEQPHPHANLEVVEDRDSLEWELFQGARAARVPMFGICRGLQTINVFLGGTLWQDLRLQWPGSLLHDLSYPRDALIHPVEAAETETELGAVLRREAPLVNSRHHQAVRRLAEDLVAVARAPDGVVEAAQGRRSDWWIWGVQWHPENLVDLTSQRSLFAAFATQADRHRRGRIAEVTP